MDYLLITDLAGTLIETIHVCNRLNNKGIQSNSVLYKNDVTIDREYYSRINYIGRKLNAFLEKSNNRIVILSSIDHTTPENLENVIKDINNTINKDNKQRIEYYVAREVITSVHYDYETANVYQLRCVMDNGNKIIEIPNKDLVYDNLLNIYQGYFPIAIDDMPSIENYSKVLERGGQCIFINNPLYTLAITANDQEEEKKRWHLNDDIDRLIGYFSRSSDRFSFSYESYEEMPEFYKFSVEETYIKLNNGELNIEELYNWLKLTDIKHDFFNIGYSIEDIEKLIEHHCIEQYPTFEMAYQRSIVPKITKTKKF